MFFFFFLSISDARCQERSCSVSVKRKSMLTKREAWRSLSGTPSCLDCVNGVLCDYEKNTGFSLKGVFWVAELTSWFCGRFNYKGPSTQSEKRVPAGRTMVHFVVFFLPPTWYKSLCTHIYMSIFAVVLPKLCPRDQTVGSCTFCWGSFIGTWGTIHGGTEPKFTLIC